MRYVPSSPSTPPSPVFPTSALPGAPSVLTPAVRRTVRDLHAAAAAGDVAGDAADAERLAGLLAALRAETTGYVCALRAEGARPEQMLVRVKALVHQAMAAEGWCDLEATQVLTADVVGWSIAAYYDR